MGAGLNMEAMLAVESVYANRAVLAETYIPSELPEREKEVEQIATRLAPMARGEPGFNFMVYGARGVGKSAAVGYVIREFQKILQKRGVRVPMITVNCREAHNFSLALSAINNALGRFVGRKPQTIKTGLMKGCHIEELANIVKQIGEGPYLIVMDEVDCLKDSDVFYDLLRMHEFSFGLNNTWIRVIGITSDFAFFEKLDSSVQSSFGNDKLIFSRYNRDQLSKVARPRVEAAFREGRYDEGITNYAVALAGDDGNARRVLKLLELAGNAADATRTPKVTCEIVREANKSVELKGVMEDIRSMPYPQKYLILALIDCVTSREDPSTGAETNAIYDRYKQVCGMMGGLQPFSIRWMVDVLKDFDRLTLTQTTLQCRGRHGSTNMISLACDPKEVLEIITKTAISSGDEVLRAVSDGIRERIEHKNAWVGRNGKLF